MKLWIDAQLSPHLVAWIEAEFQIESWSVKSLNLRDAADLEIFTAARQAEATVVTKDSDFVELLYRHGSPPKIIWLTCGNTSNKALKTIFRKRLAQALRFLENGESLVEIRD